MITRDDLKNLKSDTEKELDVAYGEYYRENHNIKTNINTETIKTNKNLLDLYHIIVDDAIDRGARNIDIYLDSKGVGIVGLRMGNSMVLDRKLDKDAVYGLSVIFRDKAGVDVETNFKSQIEGSIRYRYRDRDFDIRCAFIYTVQGMSMSLRILYPMEELTGVDVLGLPKNVEDAYLSALKSNQGLILLTGAVSSGKTTTQYAGINTIMEIFENQKNIRTIENPVEYTVSGIKQTPVNEKDGETFGKLLKMFFRGDPDVILVGEINDEETAKTAIRASTSGHLVMSTIHTNNTIEVTRVLSMYGANYIDIGNALQLVINQELEDKLCDQCKVERGINSEEYDWVRRRLGVDDVITVLYERSGKIGDEICKTCNGTGIKGSTLIVEMLEANYAYQRALNRVQDDTFKLEEELLNDDDANFYPIGRDVFRHLKAGNIDIETSKRIMKKQTGESLEEKDKSNVGG